MCDGQGSSVGRSICESWGRFSGAQSSFSSISASILGPADFEPGTRDRSPCRNLSCHRTLVVPWRNEDTFIRHRRGCFDHSSSVLLPLWSHPGLQLCTASAPVQEEQFLFVQKQNTTSYFSLVIKDYSCNTGMLPLYRTSGALDLSDIMLELENFALILWKERTSLVR